MRFIEVIFHNLASRKLHTWLTVATLTVGVAATIVLFGAAWGFAEASTASLESRGVDIVVVRAGVVERMNSSLRVLQADAIRNLPGVADVDGSLTEAVSVGNEGLLGIPLVGHNPQGFALGKFEIASGRQLATGDENCVLLGAGLAEALKKKTGDELEIEDTTFRVVGTFSSDNPLEINQVIAPLADVQKLMDRPDQVSQFEVAVDRNFASKSSVSEICNAIETLRDGEGHSLGLQALPVNEFVDTGTRSKLATALAWGTTLIAVALSSLGVLNIMLVSVLERTREIGVLRAIGWPRSRVLRMIVGESLALVCISIVVGSLSAAGLSMLLTQIPAIQELTGGRLAISAYALGAAPALMATVLGAIYPAWRAATIPATEALRYE